jgi:hypothetical protein
MDVVTTDSNSGVNGFTLLSNGMRLDTFLLYILLHCVDSREFSFTALDSTTALSVQRQTVWHGLWAVSLSILTQSHGTPSQSMADVLLSRLSECLLIQHQQKQVNNNNNNVNGNGEWLLSTSVLFITSIDYSYCCY